jgi:hypothetical protein
MKKKTCHKVAPLGRALALNIVLFLLGGGLLMAANPPSDFKYDLNETGDGVVIQKFIGKGPPRAVVIPAEIEGYPVVELADWAFSDWYYGTWYTINSNVVSVVIPDSVTKIGKHCFARHTDSTTCKITSVTLPKNLKEIGEGAFRGCNSLATIAVPANVTSIGAGAFSGCTRLTAITLPAGITSIESRLFFNCGSLKSIIIPNGIISIGQEAFYSCEGLTAVTIPEGVTSIGQEAFYFCTGITPITIPDSVASIGGRAFANCSVLTTINLTSHPITFGTYEDYGYGFAFEDCPRLTLASKKKLQDSGYKNSF